MTDFQNLPVDPSTLPRTAEQDYHGLSPGYKQARLMRVIVFGLVLLVIGLVAVSINQAWDEILEQPWTLLVGLGVWLMIVLFRVLILYRGFRRKQYALRERDITYRRGLITYQATSVPFNRVQHAEVNQGFFDRIFEIASLRVFTAGGSSSDLSIPGLDPERANYLKDYILKQAHEQAPQSS